MLSILWNTMLASGNYRRKAVVCNWTETSETMCFERDVADIMRQADIEVDINNEIPVQNNYWVVHKFGSRDNLHYEVRLNTFDRETTVTSYEEVLQYIRHFYKIG